MLSFRYFLESNTLFLLKDLLGIDFLPNKTIFKSKNDDDINVFEYEPANSVFI